MSAGEQSGMRAALEQVASELETWAIQREKNVMLLDLRGARRVRSKVSEIRTLLAGSGDLAEADVADVIAAARALTHVEASPSGPASCAVPGDDPFAPADAAHASGPATTRAPMLPEMEDSGPINFKRLLAAVDAELARQEAREAITRRPPPPARPSTLVSEGAQRSGGQDAGTRRFEQRATIEEALDLSPEDVPPHRDTLRDLVAPRGLTPR